MVSRLNPYLSFKSSAREAMAFYQSVFGGELTLNTFGDFGGAPDPAENDLIMHGQLETTSGFTLMGADTPSYMNYAAPAGMTVSLSGENAGELRGYWDRLSDGANIVVPLEKAPWGDFYGQLVDRYGTPWMVNIAGSAA